ncbi:Protein of unknown function [Gryllus bimaculatus]|nr:Protein of unknown function [Gryllus bimaculatus]
MNRLKFAGDAYWRCGRHRGRGGDEGMGSEGGSDDGRTSSTKTERHEEMDGLQDDGEVENCGGELKEYRLIKFYGHPSSRSYAPRKSGTESSRYFDEVSRQRRLQGVKIQSPKAFTFHQEHSLELYAYIRKCLYLVCSESSVT